jgi:hypothetical protein
MAFFFIFFEFLTGCGIDGVFEPQRHARDVESFGDNMDEDQEIDEIDVDESEKKPIAPLYQVADDPTKGIMLHCRIILVRDGIAYIVLTDSKGRSSFADCNAVRLRLCGVSTKVGVFDVVISKPDKIVVMIRTPKERELSESEWRFMAETVEQVLSDNKLCKSLPGYLNQYDQKTK